jgi:hypothetical protein
MRHIELLSGHIIFVDDEDYERVVSAGPNDTKAREYFGQYALTNFNASMA